VQPCAFAPLERATSPAKIKALKSSLFVRMHPRRYSEDEVIGPTVVWPPGSGP
jgi:hypothetical protein